jgi:hypothetical protein
MNEENTNNGQIELELVPEPRRGVGRYQVTAFVGEVVLHADSINLGSSRSRGHLLQELKRRAQSYGIPAQFEEWELTLLEQYHADQQVDGDNAPSSSNLADYEHVLEALQLCVLGENSDQSIQLWSTKTRKKYVIPSPAKLQTEELLQIVGVDGVGLLWLSPTPPPAGTFALTTVRSAIALAASDAPRITQNNLYGQGIWRHREHILVVNGAVAHLYNGNEFAEVEHPRLDGHVIDFNADADWSSGITAATLMMNVDVTRGLIVELEQLLRQWNWAHPADSTVIAALVFSTFIQTCWTWRPLFSGIGPSDSGKSTLIQELLLPLFGSWTICTDRSSEAGLRQAIAHHAKPVILDEFDKYDGRQRVLQLFRTSSRGGMVLRGTQNQTGVQFGLRHLPWIMAIESGDTWGQDRNRFIRCELRAPENRGALIMPAHTDLRKLGEAIAAAALWAAQAAIRLADEIKTTSVDGVPGRLVESYSVPAAMRSILMYGRDATATQAIDTLCTMLWQRVNQLEPMEPEQQMLLNDILGTNIRATVCNGGSGTQLAERTIGQLLEEIMRAYPSALNADPEVHNILQAKGIKIVQRSDGPWLFVSHDMVQRQLLADTRWSGTRTDQLLLRLPGAVRGQERCAATRRYGILLPPRVWRCSLVAQDNQQDTVTT